MRNIAVFYAINANYDNILNKMIHFFDKIDNNSLKNVKIFKNRNGFLITSEDICINGFKNPSVDNMRGHKFDSIIFEREYYYQIDSEEEDLLISTLCPYCSPDEVRVIDFEEI